MRPMKLSDDEVAERAATLDPGWSVGGGAIRRTFQFSDFAAAFAFMTRCAIAAEAMNHHPDWSNSYRTVKVSLTTHDAGGLTALDFELAAKMDAFSASPAAGEDSP